GDEQDTSVHGGGKTHPGACLPGGTVQLSPDTVTGGDNGTGYNYCGNTIEGFSFNHMSGIGWYGDLGNLQIMPVTGETELRSGSNEELPFGGKIGWKSKFSHKNEVAAAGYYSVYLDRYKIKAQATVTAHTGMLSFTYPKSKNAGIIINLSRRIAGKVDYQKITRISPTEFVGELICTPHGGGFGRGYGKINYTLYFALEISKAPLCVRAFSDEKFTDENQKNYKGEDLGLRLDFATEKDEEIVIRCGISYVDINGALNNLKVECPDFDFEKVRKNAEKIWEDTLGAIEVEGEDETDKKLFYTCLYHTFLDPRIHNDCDGRYKNASGEILTAKAPRRTMFSGWDVYRSEMPLLSLTAPEILSQEINTLISIAKEKNSTLPRWELMGIDSGCMVGDPAALVMADAYIKGIRDFDIESGYRLTVASVKGEKTVFDKPFVNTRPASENYCKQAFCPNDLSSTLEYLLADFCMASLAKELGDTQNEKYFGDRVKTYKENYSRDFGFMLPRGEDGKFAPITDRYDTFGCVESNVFQQSWCAPYDVEGLGELFGKERAITLLEELFEGADLTALWNENYNHSNEPCHNLTHYFNALKKPKRTQYWTRRVQKEAYRTGAFGFCGNEDVGQLSAWYVMASLGLAQVCIGKPEFWLNTPLFKSVTVKLNKKYHSCKNAETFTVKCDKNPLKYPYIDKILWNGEEIKDFKISYFKLTEGGTLYFLLTDKE
ncbi:MAG: GH92 family glycosyl hydrolase, partial [Oscillospiraceae bacterium]|nr:GH92 family glycosyl hydrolase [Candidatus Equicaccousia limihippi]